MPIIQIVPQLPPAINGLGDYALNLACQIRNDHALETEFIVCDPVWKGESEIEGFPVHQSNSRSSTDLIAQLNQLQATTVLLHYVGYGYAKKGCPTWLIKALERWKASHPNSRLVTMFHEPYASGPIWTSAFWLSSLQKQLATRLARLSDRCVTSNEIVTSILERMVNPTTQADIITLPVFSNVGEPDHLKPLADRPRRLVVFGSRGIRKRVYEQAYANLSATLKALEIETIYDIGASTGLDITQVEDIPIVRLGKCSAAEVSEHLQQAIAGFLDYPPRLLAKSTVFAAYAAHRVIPIVNAPLENIRIDGLESGKHYRIAESAEVLNPLDGEAIAYNAHQWYQTHNLVTQARVMAAHIAGAS